MFDKYPYPPSARPRRKRTRSILQLRSRWLLISLLLLAHPIGIATAQSTGDRSGLTVNPQNREESLTFFQTYYVPTAPPHNWNGNPATCAAGETAVEFRAAVALRINYFRAMAGVPADIVLLDEYNRQAQQAALMISANRRSSHDPTPDWTCYSAAGATAAAKSNLYLGVFGPMAVDGYIRDPGDDNYFVGHRRWLLFPQTRFMGSGDLPPVGEQQAANALWVFDEHADDPRPPTRDEFVAWPPAGYVPYQVIYPRWSFAYPNADFTDATVTMTQGNQLITTTQATVEEGSGDNTLVWRTAVTTGTSQWPKPSTDTAYQVVIDQVMLNGTPHDFSYTVTVFDPAQPTAPEPTGVKRLYLPIIVR